jgi:DNA-binding Lrp family transcriptional regulator
VSARTWGFKSPLAHPYDAVASSGFAATDGEAAAAVIHAIVLINAEPARIAALASDIADLDGVSAAYSVAGDEDIVVVIRVSDHESLADLVTGSIAAQPGVVRTRTLIAFRVYSQADFESI